MMPLDAAQVSRFVEAARSDRYHALFDLAVSTGMRRSALGSGPGALDAMAAGMGGAGAGRRGARLLAAMALFGCGEAPSPTWLVVITLDTTRADALGAYGQALPVTPRIDAMAADGALRRVARPFRVLPHATLFTGRAPTHVPLGFGYRLRTARGPWPVLGERGVATQRRSPRGARSGQGLAQGSRRTPSDADRRARAVDRRDLSPSSGAG
jgi:hypothetical protein